MAGDNYYQNQLAAERLRHCYEFAPPRVQQYLNSEIEYVLSHIRNDNCVLELGCGYGRVIKELAGKARRIIGIDTSLASLHMASEFVSRENCSWGQMDAAQLALRDQSVDCTVCIQNGISAFHVDPSLLVAEALRVTKSGGIVLFSSYAGKFWDDRLVWFRLQAKAGLLGEIDEEKTGNGTIVCKDGFSATTFRAHDFHALTVNLGVDVHIEEVDESSLFCRIVRTK